MTVEVEMTVGGGVVEGQTGRQAANKEANAAALRLRAVLNLSRAGTEQAVRELVISWFPPFAQRRREGWGTHIGT